MTLLKNTCIVFFLHIIWSLLGKWTTEINVTKLLSFTTIDFGILFTDFLGNSMKNSRNFIKPSEILM